MESRVPSIANNHRRGSISAYSAPPTKIIARCGSSQAAAVAKTPRPATTTRLRIRAVRRSPTEAMEGKAMITTNCGRNSTAFVRISPAA